MSLRAAILKNTGTQVLGRVITTAIGIASVSLLLRHLGANGFGAYTIATSYLQFFAIIIDFGLTLTALQMLGEADAEEERRLLANLTGLRVVTATALFAIAPISALFIPQYTTEIRQSILIGTLAFGLISLNQVLSCIFQKHLAMHIVAGAEIIGRAAMLGAIAFTAARGGSVMDMMWAMVIGNLVPFLASIIFGRKFVPIGLAFDFTAWKKIIARAWPIGVSTFLNLLYLRGDIIILSLARPGSPEIGLYGAAYKVIDVATAIPFMFMGLALPPLTRAWKAQDKVRLAHQFQQSFDALALVGTGMLVGGIFLARPLITLVGGAEFSDAANLLVILLIGLFILFIGTLFGHGVVAVNKQQAMIKGYFANAIISLALYALLIPQFGATAAAWVTVLSELLIAIFTFKTVQKTTGFVPSLKIFVKLAPATIAMAILLSLLKNSFALAFVSGSLIYGLGAYLTGAIPKELVMQLLKKKEKTADTSAPVSP